MSENEKYKLAITYNDWNNYIKIKKTKLLRQLDNTSYLDNSNESKIFITILKAIFNMDMFNMSRISYLAFSFLDIYINSYLINILQNDKHIYHITNISSLNDKQINNNTKIILQFIINLIIQIEFILNLHLFIIIYIIYQNTELSQHNKNITNNEDKANSIPGTFMFSKPKILYKVEKICDDIQSSIKPSTTILLLLKINRKLCNILDVFDTSLLLKESGLIKNAKELNSKINNLLDAFILAIAKNTKCQNTTSTSTNAKANNNIMIERYELCINYVLDLANILYMYFDIAFETFIKYLKLENTSNDNSHTRFDNTKKCISDLLKCELITLETKFFEY